MNSAEREAMRRQTWAAAERAYAAYRRGQRILAWGIIMGTLGGALGFTAGGLLAAATIRHAGLRWERAGLAALTWMATAAVIWGGYWLWSRQR